MPVPIVGVIDSGTDPSIPWIDQLVVAREHHHPPAESDYSHGSLVAALAASGGGFGPGSVPAPVARIVDIQALPANNGIQEDDLLVLIEDAVQRYGPGATSRPNGVDQPVRVWNLSLGADAPCDEDDLSTLAYELDRIASEQGVLFIIAAGNYGLPPLRGWTAGQGPDRGFRGLDRVTSPADSVFAISVGSISDSSSSPSAAPADHPSPFSRRGPGPMMLVKPELVHYGGSSGRNLERAGTVRGPDRAGVPLEDVGTSFAAPRVSAGVASLVNAIPDATPELLKAIAILSAEITGDLDLRKRDRVNYYGFGALVDSTRVLSCAPWESTLILRGELRPGFPLQFAFPFPDCLSNGARRRGIIRAALVYEPVVDSSKGSEYLQTNVSLSIGRRLKPDTAKKLKYHRDVDPVPDNHGSCPAPCESTH